MPKKTELWYIAQQTLKAYRTNNVRCLKRNPPERERKEKEIDKILKTLEEKVDK